MDETRPAHADLRSFLDALRAAGELVEVDLPHLDGATAIRAGDRVTLGWPTARARCFRRTA